MSANEFGKIFKITSFGESHAKAVGGIIQGMPAGFAVDLDKIQIELNKRRPGFGKFSSPRKEEDKLIILSGIFEGKTLGTPIAFMIENTNQKPKDYDNLKNVYRPSHADFTWEQKFGIRDYRGGGRASARETASRIVAGALAMQFLEKNQISIKAFTKSIGNIVIGDNIQIPDKENIYNSDLRTIDKAAEEKMNNLLDKIKADGDSIGGVVECRISGVKAGIGEPVFDKLNARLSYAMMGINAVKAIEFGLGFKAAEVPASQQNDSFTIVNDKIQTTSNYSAGIQGGISNAEEIYFSVAFKSIASISKTQKTVDSNKNQINLNVKGRHDVCIVPRAVPIVEAMAAITIMDFLLLQKIND
jgi:chorismate synthase